MNSDVVLECSGSVSGREMEMEMIVMMVEIIARVLVHAAPGRIAMFSAGVDVMRLGMRRGKMWR